MILSRLPRLAALAMLASLTSCALVSSPDPIAVYLLPGTLASPASTGQPAAAPLDLSLRVSTPQASQILGGPRIAVIPEGNRISSYKGARWSDSAPVLLRNRLVEAFQEDGRIASVTSDDVKVHADVELFSDLRAFQTEYIEGAPVVVIRLDLRLLHHASQRIVASQRLEVRQPSRGESVDQVVQAFGEASDRLSAEVVNWTLAQQPRLAPGQGPR
ncbi:hypothetical protein DN826_03295 [Stutzerimonas nosocomialis]|uniref:ABC-type transport auxiliary lipoprotein family protein n=1 Tax=Stutzerimonas nosocomialis TaxID=1056496 RepID=UPI0011089701|nr:ABC-type transport auxiliary lipoprotein family protein [Stutzerimonas nosocomialis]TLX58960.1 hypothetical protein DN826_03295 [Stutzerimonas nosocomialis]